MSKEQPRISAVVRMELNALADGLTEDGDTFSAPQARRLIELLPLTPRPSVMQARAAWSAPGGATEALTDTGHLASAGTGEARGGFTIGSDGTFRVGQWKLGHRPGHVQIGQVIEDSMEPKVCRLRYDRLTRAPIDMQWPRWRRLGIGPFAMSLMAGWREWKRPI